MQGHAVDTVPLGLLLTLQGWVILFPSALPTTQVLGFAYVTLLENTVFADVIRILKSSYWIRTGPESLVTHVRRRMFEHRDKIPGETSM